MNKVDCPHFINVGNVCSRIDGMARCDEYSECEFKYIDALKEENRQMKEKLEKIEKAIINCLDGYIKEYNLEYKNCSSCSLYKECKTDIEKYILRIIRGEE